MWWRWLIEVSAILSSGWARIRVHCRQQGGMGRPSGKCRLKGLTPYEYICKIWTTEPERFKLDPIHQMPGLNT